MKISVVKKEQQHSFDSEKDERILYAGLRQGLKLPHECATGTCGSCKAVLNTGEIRKLWGDAPGAKGCKASKNEFLMCQSTAITDCEIGFRGGLNFIDSSAGRPDYFTGQIFDSTLLTPDVMQFWVRFDQPLAFQPGQFMVITVPGLEGGRAYSMVNYDRDSRELEFIVKRLPGGEFSNWVFNEVRNDASVTVFGPLGVATLGQDEGRDLICITGGSGIAGIISLLGRAVEDGFFDDNRAHLFFGVRTRQDLFFQQRLLELNHITDHKLSITFAFSDQAVAGETDPIQPGVSYLHGFVGPLAMAEIGQDFSNEIVFLAGPPVMVDDVIRQLVLEVGCPADAIRYDKFG